MHLYPIANLELFCTLLKLHASKFQPERSIWRCSPPDQPKPLQIPVMKMLTRGPGPCMEGMQIALGYVEIMHMKYATFCYFKINSFPGGDTIYRTLHSKSQYIAYVSYPKSGTPKDLPQSGIWYLGQVTFLLASCKNDLQKCLQNGPPMSALYFLT